MVDQISGNRKMLKMMC